MAPPASTDALGSWTMWVIRVSWNPSAWNQGTLKVLSFVPVTPSCLGSQVLNSGTACNDYSQPRGFVIGITKFLRTLATGALITFLSAFLSGCASTRSDITKGTGVILHVNNRWTGKTVVITGVSSGFGRGAARRFASEGANVGSYVSTALTASVQLEHPHCLQDSTGLDLLSRT